MAAVERLTRLDIIEPEEPADATYEVCRCLLQCFTLQSCVLHHNPSGQPQERRKANIQIMSKFDTIRHIMSNLEII